MIIFLTLITLVVVLAQAISARRLFSYVENELNVKIGAYIPPVSVILPCKGLDRGFAENIKKLLAQDYRVDEQSPPNYEVIFAVATKDDPAYEILAALSAENLRIRTQLVVAGIDRRRGQKINNQLVALSHVSPDTEVLVFVDSDVIARPDFLRYLVNHLSDETVGATTGYRFYIPFAGGWAALIRALWNRMSAWELADPKYAFAWGGAMAITRANFARAKIKEAWDQSVDDDLALTTAVKAVGLKVKFIPQCLVATNGDGSLSEIVEWLNRQLILTKVYYRPLWRKAIFRAVILAIWLIAILGSFSVGIAYKNIDYVVAGGIGLLLIPLEYFFLLKAQSLWRRVLLPYFNESGFTNSTAGGNAQELNENSIYQAYNDSFFKFTLVLPLAHLVLPWLSLYSLATNRIKWRGIYYELRSPSETVTI